MTKVAFGVAKTVEIGYGLMVSFSFRIHPKKKALDHWSKALHTWVRVSLRSH
jgi:hypothetical protein